MKQIPLNKGMVTIVSDEDFDKLSKYKWYAHKKRDKYYAASSIDGKYVSMHRMILGIEDKNIFADHINGDTLNNTRSNIRIASPKQNTRNLTRNNTRNTSGFRGVYLKKDKDRPNPWCAKIRVDGKLISLGHFRTPEEAAKAFDIAAKLYFGEFHGKLNFD